jgi:hypothetical protein
MGLERCRSCSLGLTAFLYFFYWYFMLLAQAAGTMDSVLKQV